MTTDKFNTLRTAFITVIGSLLYVMGMALSQILRHRKSNLLIEIPQDKFDIWQKKRTLLAFVLVL
jgi:hypothetical protein